MDRRQKKTRQAIYDAFARLLETHSYSGISVQQIADEADIGRSTFYSHFETKDELLKSLCAEVFRHVFSHPEDRRHEQGPAEDPQTFQNEITHMLRHLRDSKGYLRRILSCESSELFMRYFKESLEQVFDRLLPQEQSGVPRAYILNHMVCDFAESVRWWMKHPEYKPEDISRFFFDTTLRSYRPK